MVQYLKLILLAFLFSCCYSIEISKEYREYIEKVLQKYKEGTIPRHFHEIFPERSRVENVPSPYHYTLPNLFVWDPLLQYEDIFILEPMVCQQHNQCLEPARWSDGSSNSLNPRVILETDGPALLVSRDYYCKSNSTRHYIRSTDGEFLRYISSYIELPFMLTHKYGFTKTFVKKIRDYASNGLSFNLLQASYIENQLEKCEEAIKHYKKHCDLHQKLLGTSLTIDSKELVFEEFQDFLVKLCPSDDLLCDIFLKDFNNRKTMYEYSMRDITATSLMADHTFKVTVNIGVKRQTDNAWVKQFNSLFLVLNEKHEVVTWKLTKKEQFDMVKEVLENLKERVSAQGGNIEIFMIDNCCKWKNKIQDVFGKDVSVLLDLFHAVQRITKTICKQHVFYTDCVHDLSMVFRSPDDTGKKREKPTPDIEKLSQNLDRFIQKWQHISETTTGSLLRDSFQEQINNLRQHVNGGCLSGIPPGYSTSTNECLHEKLNDLFAGAKMGPELAVALLTVFFYAWNSRKNNKINGIPIVKPLKPLESNIEFHKKEKFGLGSKLGVENDPNQVPTNNTPSENLLKHDLVSRAMSLLSLFKNLKKRSDKKFQVNLYQLFFEGEILKYLLKSSAVTQPVEKRQNSIQESTSKMFGMEVKPMPKNGDCLFHAITTAILQYFNRADGENDLIGKHFISLGLSFEMTTYKMVEQLRNIMVDELVKNKDKYIGFLEKDRKNGYDEIVQKYRLPGVFSGDVGDLMVKALANVLQVPILLLTSLANYPILTVTPDVFKDGSSDYCIFVAFNPEGPGHYDAIIEKEENGKPYQAQKKKGCTCGMNSKEAKKVCVSHKMMVTGNSHYNSRCPCLRGEKPCTEDCKCKECNNPNGIRPTLPKQRERKRKRTVDESSGSRKSGIEFLMAEEEPIELGKWTDEENAILLQHLVDKPDVLDHLQDEEAIIQLTEKYNESLTLAANTLGFKGLKTRQKASIEKKLSHIRKKKELLYLILSAQIKIFIKELGKDDSDGS